MTWLLVVAWLWPLLLAGTYLPSLSAGAHAAPGQGGLGSARATLLLSAPVPALVAGLTLPEDVTLVLPWLFLGTELRLDAVARVYLIFTSLLWLAATVYAAFAFRRDAHGRRFAALFLLAMAGNLWLIVGRDLPSFYAGFALMGLAAYGLVIHDQSPKALRAGKVYLVMALFGEVCLFAALVMIAAEAGTTTPSAGDLAGLGPLPIGLLLLGLGVKAGMVPVHLWLPLAHPAAPIPASAVLSGAMIKVALLGWLRFLPVGAAALPDWGGLLTALGLLTLFYALPIGLVQSDPKTVLAYSSISKMGLLLLLLGLILIEPALAPLGVAALALYAAHHALVKGGLFLGVGLRKHAPLQPLVLGALIFLALALAGAPFTSGAVAKYAVKPVIDSAQWPWIAAAIAVGSVGTTLLMGRFLWVSIGTRPHPEPGWLWPGLAWGLLLALVALFPFVLGTGPAWLTNIVTVPLGIAAAALIAVAAWRNPAWLRPLPGLVVPGDLVVFAAPLRNLIVRLWLALWRPLLRRLLDLRHLAESRYQAVFDRPPGDTERGLRAWPVAGGLWIGITALLTLLMLAAQPLVPGMTASAPGAAPAAEPDAGEDFEVVRPSPDVILGVRAPQTQAERPAPAAADGAENGDRPAAPQAEDLAHRSVVGDPSGSSTAASPGAQADDATPAPAPPIPAEDGAHDVALQTHEPPSSGSDEPAPELAAKSAATAPKGRTGSDGGDDSRPTPCEPEVPYRFRPAGGGGTLELRRCEVDADGNPRLLPAPEPSRALIRAVQQALQSRGYDPGPIDGLLGPRTRSALRALQRDQGGPISGDIGFATLDLLQATGGTP